MRVETNTTCPYCGVGCGVIAVREAGETTVRGDPHHPANFGRLCSKGTALAATLGPEDRLLAPMVDRQVSTWDTALDHVANRFLDCIAKNGPESVAFYVSGQLLTEDYYVANKLMKGYIGTANIDTNSRLCMSSAVSGHVRAFGEDLVPVSYSDLEHSDLIVLVGSNTAWCHPVLMQRILAAKEARPQLKVVVIDPRRTATCESADLHLPLRSGSDVLLFNGLLAWLFERGFANSEFIESSTNGIAEALAAARVASMDVAATAQACGLDIACVQQFFELFASTEKVVTAFSQGVNQSSAGTDKVNSIINCHLATGRIGRAGMGPFSITGQPNAMGGREVGGLATQLAAHLSLDHPDHRGAVQTFWNSPRMADRAGLKAVELFDAMDAGRIKAVWIMATNPLVSLPDAEVVRRALNKCEFVVMSDCVADNDSLRWAHVKLPAAGWGEKDGTVTNSDRHVSRQRAFLPLPGMARPDWWIICQVARRMGFSQGFNFSSAAQIFDEHARLTGLSVKFGFKLDLSGFDAMRPRQWPMSPGTESREVLFADGKFPTVDGRARFVPTAPRAPRHATTQEFPLILNTGRIRDQWHTMTRTGRAPVLNAHEPEPFIDMHESDLQAAGLTRGELARVVTRWGAAVARVRSSGDQPQGMVFVPIHWSETFARNSIVGAAVNPVVDALSGEPEFKHTPARVEAWPVDWTGFLLIRNSIVRPSCAWWAVSKSAHHLRYELAGAKTERPDAAWLRQWLGDVADQSDWLEYEDAANGSYRAALVCGGRLEACLLVATDSLLPKRGWLASLFEVPAISVTDRRSLLRGEPLGGRFDPGPTICACYSVGENTITRAIGEGFQTVAAIGQRLRAGTNCGSCRPELQKLIGQRTQGPVAHQATGLAFNGN
jgi:assimilatory nitrate reductase catalytic subunit